MIIRKAANKALNGVLAQNNNGHIFDVIVSINDGPLYRHIAVYHESLGYTLVARSYGAAYVTTSVITTITVVIT